MKTLTSLLVAALLPHLASAVDLTTIPENNPEALAAALQAEKGQVKGEPFITTDSGPDGKPTKVLVFPTPDSLVAIPVSPKANHWRLTANLRIDGLPYGKAGGAMFGVLFGTNDSVLSIAADKWSKINAPILSCGPTILITDEEFRASGAMEIGDWRKVSLAIIGTDWSLSIGDSFDRSGTVENDERGVLARKGPFFVRIGCFVGSSTLPDLSQD